MKNRIRTLRQEAEMSQKDLANNLGVTQATISNWEKGTSSPDQLSQLHMCFLFKCTIDYLLGMGQDSIPGKRGWTGEMECNTYEYLTKNSPHFVDFCTKRDEAQDKAEQKWLVSQVTEEDTNDRDEAMEQYLRDKWEESGRIGTVEGYTINMITENLSHEDRLKLLNVVRAMFPEESSF